MVHYLVFQSWTFSLPLLFKHFLIYFSLFGKRCYHPWKFVMEKIVENLQFNFSVSFSFLLFFLFLLLCVYDHDWWRAECPLCAVSVTEGAEDGGGGVCCHRTGQAGLLHLQSGQGEVFIKAIRPELLLSGEPLVCFGVALFASTCCLNNCLGGWAVRVCRKNRRLGFKSHFP